MQRRAWLGLAAASALVAGCGFELRRPHAFPFTKVLAGFALNTPLGAELASQLRANGRVVLLTDARQARDAEVILDILQDKRERAVVGLNAAGQVRELQLRMTVTFRLRSPEGLDWIEPQEIDLQRDLSYTETLALSKGLEEAMLYKDMQDDIVWQILRRLAHARPPGQG